MKTLLAIALLISLISCGGSPVTTKSLDQSPIEAQPGVIYYIGDHLGSAHLITDSRGAIIREESRYPFGLTRQVNAQDSTVDVQADYTYTGKEYDAETGLVYFGGRYYAPQLGRWTTPDPYFLEKQPLAAVEKALSANLYAYVRNNAVTLIDLLGFIEGSPTNLAKRALIDSIARGYDSSTLWAKAVKKDDFAKGTNKCNKFVYDVTKEAGAEGLMGPRPPLAAEWADENTTIPNWRALPKGENPQAGDVGAYKMSGGGTAYSGHTGIMISDGEDKVTNMSAHEKKVSTRKGQFQSEDATRYRRFIGD